MRQVDNSNQKEHEQTRAEIRSCTEQIDATTSEHIVTSKVEVIEAIGVTNETNKLEHKGTQQQIAELQESLRILSQQMRDRDMELKELLVAYNRTRNKKKRQQLGERSNAVTAALLALETVYRSLQVSILTDQKKLIYYLLTYH